MRGDPPKPLSPAERLDEVAHLHGEGRSLDDIARQLESDPNTVRGWIERKRDASPSPESETE